MEQSNFYKPLDGLKECEDLYDALWKKACSNCILGTDEMQDARNKLLFFFRLAGDGLLRTTMVREWRKLYL